MNVDDILLATTHLNVTTSTHTNPYCKNEQIINYLNTTVPLLWVIVGTITNILSLFVLSRRSMRRNSTFFYLAIMSFSDIIMIWTSSFRDFLAYKFQIYINGAIACKIHVFLFFVFAQFSSWLLVGANLDRLVCVVSIQKSKVWCTRRTGVQVAIGLIVILSFINFHFLIFLESISLNSSSSSLTDIVTVHPYVYPKCTLKNYSTYISFYRNIYTWIDSCLYCIIPFIIMSICNTALIKRVFTTKRNLFNKVPSEQRQRLNSSEQQQQQQHRLSGGVILSKFFPKNPIKSPEKQSNTTTAYSVLQIKQNQNQDSIDRMRNMAITVIGVTILFIVFTVPINMYIPITLASVSSSSSSNDTNKSDTNHSHEPECQDLLFSILNNMVNANHSINFFIYLLTNSKFNKEFKAMFWSFIQTISKRLHLPLKSRQLQTKGASTTYLGATTVGKTLTTTATQNNTKYNSSIIEKNDKQLNKIESYNQNQITTLENPNIKNNCNE